MDILVKTLAFVLFVSWSYDVHADGRNYNFVADSNTDSIFLDKCKIYRDLLKNQDAELFKTFVAPKFHEHPGLVKQFEVYVKAYEREVSAETYTLNSIVIVQLEDQNFAGVDYIYSSHNGKGSGNSGCTFTRLEGNHWKLRPR
ncbi:hypothetical protein [Shewanella donghaensis]|uniref:hypothetical protein n=1 Tax=Shewanella donghaensis TaxID=238836 RepID=UPI00118408CB|nr:hypothetical protein [Shewanella donghaensis]